MAAPLSVLHSAIPRFVWIHWILHIVDFLYSFFFLDTRTRKRQKKYPWYSFGVNFPPLQILILFPPSETLESPRTYLQLCMYENRKRNNRILMNNNTTIFPFPKLWMLFPSLTVIIYIYIYVCTWSTIYLINCFFFICSFDLYFILRFFILTFGPVLIWCRFMFWVPLVHHGSGSVGTLVTRVRSNTRPLRERRWDP